MLKAYTMFTDEKLGFMLLFVYKAINCSYLKRLLSAASQNPQWEASIPHNLPFAHPRSLISTLLISEMGIFLLLPNGK